MIAARIPETWQKRPGQVLFIHAGAPEVPFWLMMRQIILPYLSFPKPFSFLNSAPLMITTVSVPSWIQLATYMLTTRSSKYCSELLNTQKRFFRSALIHAGAEGS